MSTRYPAGAATTCARSARKGEPHGGRVGMYRPDDATRPPFPLCALHAGTVRREGSKLWRVGIGPRSNKAPKGAER